MKILYSVDNQSDYYPPSGSFKIPYADSIIENVDKLTKYSKNNILFGSMESYKNNDPEFKKFPEHCILSTDGWMLIDEATPVDIMFSFVPKEIENIEFDPNEAYFFEKACIDIWDTTRGNKNIDEYIKQIDVKEVYVFGLTTNFSILSSVKGFISRGIKVYLITDAMKGIYVNDDDNEETAIKEMVRLGAKKILTDNVITNDKRFF